MVPVTDRRRVGLLVVVLGLMAAVIVPNVIGRPIPGVAQAVPVPEPPPVGACVGQEFDPAWDMVFDSDPSKYRYPELVLGDCSQAHYGEVVSVIARPAKPEVVVLSGGGVVIDDNNMVVCNQATGRFLGLVDSAITPALFGYWSLASFPAVVALTPTVRQRAAGARWLACATYLVNEPVVDRGSLIRYQGSLRDAASTGVGRDYLGRCPTEADWNQMTSSSCTKPHHGEVFGIGGAPQDVTRATLVSSCTKLVEQVAQNPGLVRGGQLAVSVQATRNGETVEGATIPKNSTSQCGVVAAGGRMLQGSLIAIGTDSLPWA